MKMSHLLSFLSFVIEEVTSSKTHGITLQSLCIRSQFVACQFLISD